MISYDDIHPLLIVCQANYAFVLHNVILLWYQTPHQVYILKLQSKYICK